jgi:phosphotransferase system enzyme I (PtsI)
MTTEQRLIGRPAAAGFYAGPLVFMGPNDLPRRRPSGEVHTEAAALRDAVAAALADALAMAAAAEGEAADMIGFQAAMLEDPELVRSALVAIADGTPADSAWSAAMAAEISEYAAAEQEYFRARTADLQDIRDAVLAKLRPGVVREVPARGVIVADDLPLSRFLAIDFSGGGAILLTAGSRTSHVAMLARARLIPMIVGLGEMPETLAGRFTLVDGTAGEVIVDPTEATSVSFAARRQAGEQAADAGKHFLAAPARTADGTDVAMHLNIVGADELARLDPGICDGIGLFRTEFLFHGEKSLPDEDAQYTVYRRVVEWAQGRPVTIRTLDAGGDKPLPGITAAGESNPFLGLRGLRLSLRHPRLFAVQLRALLRAARHGEIRIMLPMVTVPEELEAARALLEAEIAAFERTGEAVPRPKLGIMVEVPAAAITIERFDAAFFSIGSNDLTQYVTAAGRDMEDVADLADPTNPAVIRLIEVVVRHGRQSGRDVSLCGDAGGDPAVVPALLRAGLRSLSVAPELLAGAKRAVASVALAR